ncbi:hypothetical protein Clacol_005647 [Clathrus columnatus]|uniref:PX domain-containing protein n=1 Tax=Clathrus columnatus TaxID=1419009 RepID=A0AAV5A9X9_9AGAM|nr:hypothetical protein Clacol_005647 [Clathrus columnatus]
MFSLVTANPLFIPEKYHQFIDSNIRRIYLDDSKTKRLQDRVTHLEARLRSLEADKELLMKRCESSMQRADTYAAKERIARLNNDSLAKELMHANESVAQLTRLMNSENRRPKQNPTPSLIDSILERTPSTKDNRSCTLDSPAKKTQFRDGSNESNIPVKRRRVTRNQHIAPPNSVTGRRSLRRQTPHCLCSILPSGHMSFDDLLNSSHSNPILDNPFEDPFARPRSPDPWSTYEPPVTTATGFEYEELAQTPATVTEQQTASNFYETPSSHPNSPPKSPEVEPLNIHSQEETDSELLSGNLPSQQDTHSSQHPSPVISPIIPTPNSVTHTLPTSGDSEGPSFNSVSPTADSSNETQTVSTPISEQLPPIPQQEPTSPISSRVQSSEVNLSSPPPSGVVSPLDDSYTNDHGYRSFSASENTEWLNGPNLRYSGGDAWNSGWGTHAATSSLDGSGNGVLPTSNDEDDDDDVPIAHKKQALVAAAAAAASSALSEQKEPEEPSGEPPLFIITVGDPQKVGDPVRPYITYTVHTRTTSPLYRSSSFSVLRRYSDFRWLYETLSQNCPGVIVPPVPEKQQYGRFEDSFVENRRAALNKCIQKIANHPILRDDPDLKLFLESDTFALDIKHRKAEIAHERGGLMASIGSSLVGPKFYETDEWFDTKKAYLDTLETQLRSLVKTVDAVTKQRNEVALSINEFAENINALATCDVGKQLSSTLNLLADVQKKAKELQDLQARQDVATLMSTADEYARLVNSVRLAFSSRVRLYINWQIMDNEMKKVQQAHEKARRQGRIPQDRVASSLSEVAEAERRAMEAKHDFDKTSKTIKSEMARFERERVEDFKDILVTFLEGMISRQKEILQAWEDYQATLLNRVTTLNAKQQQTASSSPAIAATM